MSGCDHSWTVSGLWAGTVPGCESPLELACRACGETVGIKCGTSRASKCEPCAAVYRGRVGRVAGSGLVVGRHGVFLTLTAPGTAQHADARGRVCRCTPAGGVDLAAWNADASARWNRFLRDLSRATGANFYAFDGSGRRREVQGLSYFRAAEVQRRGALHYHVLMKRRDGKPLAIARALVRRLAMKHGFGHSVDVQRLEPGHASYVAKYVAKSADERRDVPWLSVKQKRNVREELPDGSAVIHDRRTVVSYHPSFRTWSASRTWGQSMAEVKQAQQHHVLVLAALPSWAERESSPGWACLDVPACPQSRDLEPVPI